jgi:NAD(P)-dependent dehydrogenase (short-subunit alcohol dehydrogenase family)
MNNTPAATAANLQGKTVVVIGGSSNIGFAVAEAAAAEGASVVIGSSSHKRVTAALERLPHSARGLEVDATDEASVAGFFAEAGPLDHLAFTAGEWIHTSLGSPAEVDLDRLRDIASVRVFGFLRAVKYGVRQIAPDGSVTFTGGAFLDRPQRGSWHIASLGALVTLAPALAVELAPLRVNVVSPGFFCEAPDSQDDPLAVAMRKAIAPALPRLPAGRLGRSAEAAQAYLYSMKSTYTTGQEIIIDGGLSVPR